MDNTRLSQVCIFWNYSWSGREEGVERETHADSQEPITVWQKQTVLLWCQKAVLCNLYQNPVNLDNGGWRNVNTSFTKAYKSDEFSANRWMTLSWLMRQDHMENYQFAFWDELKAKRESQQKGCISVTAIDRKLLSEVEIILVLRLKED